jgi:hypothetical protein
LGSRRSVSGTPVLDIIHASCRKEIKNNAEINAKRPLEIGRAVLQPGCEIGLAAAGRPVRSSPSNSILFPKDVTSQMLYKALPALTSF